MIFNARLLLTIVVLFLPNTTQALPFLCKWCSPEKEYEALTIKYNDCVNTIKKYEDAKCLSKQEYQEIISNLESLILNNKNLQEQAIKLKKIQQAVPKITLDELSIVIDQAGHVFVLDNLNGKMELEDLKYDIAVKLNTSIVKTKQREYGFNLGLKAAVVQNFERQPDNSIKDYFSPAIAVESFYYKYLNFNIVAGPRLYGPAMGIDVTNHMDFLVGLGFRYDDKKTFFTGLAFDF